jgi:Putative zinc-finger
MKKQIVQNKQNCPMEEISLYLDGELSSGDELVLEKHLAVCETCLAQLNSQKEMLLALDFAFEKENEIELPKDFTKVIVAHAESGVKGLRSKKERSSALFLCSGLFLLITLGLGTENEKVFNSFIGFSRHFIAITGFTFHLILDVTTGAIVVLRCLSQQIIYSPIFMVTLFVSGFILVALTLTHFNGRFKRS